MTRSSHWTRRIALALIALLALGSLGGRLQSTTLRGTVFNDANRNGKRDAGEGPVVDIRIQVSTPDLSFVQEYRTGEDGTFGPAVSQGTFNVKIIPPEGWTVTTQSAYTIFVKQGEAALGLDFGLVSGAGSGRPAGATSGSGTTAKPGALPATGGEPSVDVWPFVSAWLIVCGAAFIGLTALAPGVRRK